MSRIMRKKQLRRRRFLRGFRKFCVFCVILIVVVAAIRYVSKTDALTTAKLEREGYPQSLIELMERNPETKDFVLNYKKNKGKSKKINFSKEVKEGEIPLFLQWDERWGYETYGDDFLALTGCGPTCLSMVYCGLGGGTKWNPYEVASMAEKNGFYVEGTGSSWELMSAGAERLGLTVEEVRFDADHIKAELEDGHPIICAMGPGDFTTSGHFIVLAGIDKNGKIIVRDPNSKINSDTAWDIDKLMSQTRNLWGYRL